MTVDERLQVVTRHEADRVVLELHGELDLAGAPLLAGEIGRAESKAPRLLVLDLENLEFVDSAGLRVMLAAHQRAAERGAEFALTPGTPQVQRLLTIAGVGEHLQTLASSDGSAAGASADAHGAQPTA
jgi:anti-sigma B factor antagonist